MTTMSATMEALNNRLNQLESQVVPPAQNLAGVVAQRRTEAPSATAARSASATRRRPSVQQLEVAAEDFPAPPVLTPAIGTEEDMETERSAPASSRSPSAKDPRYTSVSEDSIKKDFLKRDYRLTGTGRLDIWIAQLQSECRARGFPDPSREDVDFA